MPVAASNMDLAEQVTSMVKRHQGVRRIELVGSRATGEARPESDWDFCVEAADFGSVADALPQLLASLNPLAQQWDRLSDEQCWMLILRGPVKLDLIFAGTQHAHEPPWEPSADNLAALDAHFWDWLLWLRGKAAGRKHELVTAELRKLFDHLLSPLGVERPPTSIDEAVALYRAARADAETRFGSMVPRELEREVAPALARRASVSGPCENPAVELTVRVAGRNEDAHIPIPDGTSPKEELTRFLNRQGPYAQLWIRLSSGEYVRYEHIVSIADPTRHNS